MTTPDYFQDDNMQQERINHLANLLNMEAVFALGSSYADRQAIIANLWVLFLHLLSHCGDEASVKRLLEAQVDEPEFSHPFQPPWKGSLKNFLESDRTAIDKANAWIMNLRFGNYK